MNFLEPKPVYGEKMKAEMRAYEHAEKVAETSTYECETAVTTVSETVAETAEVVDILSANYWGNLNVLKEMKAIAFKDVEVEAIEWFDRKFPNATCHACDIPVDGENVVMCGEGWGHGCETWYCGSCHSHRDL